MGGGFRSVRPMSALERHGGESRVGEIFRCANLVMKCSFRAVFYEDLADRIESDVFGRMVLLVKVSLG